MKAVKEPDPIPDDLGLKIGTQEQSFWEKVSERATQMILESQHEIIIQREVKALAERMVAEEKRKFK